MTTFLTMPVSTPRLVFFPEQYTGDTQDAVPVPKQVLIDTMVEEIAGLLECVNLDLGGVN